MSEAKFTEFVQTTGLLKCFYGQMSQDTMGVFKDDDMDEFIGYIDEDTAQYLPALNELEVDTSPLEAVADALKEMLRNWKVIQGKGDLEPAYMVEQCSALLKQLSEEHLVPIVTSMRSSCINPTAVDRINELRELAIANQQPLAS